MATFASHDRIRHTDLDQCQAEVEDLRHAMETRPVIDQAKGVLIAKHGCTPDEAFDMLSTASQRTNKKVREIAAGIVSTMQEGGPDPAPPQA